MIIEDVKKVLKIAAASLANNKARTALTVIGIIIGIAAVIIVMSAGEGLKGLVMAQVDAFGSDVIQIETKVPTAGKNSSENAMGMAQGIVITTLTQADAEAIAKVPNIKNYYAASFDQEVVSYLGENKSANIIACTPGYVEIGSSRVASGRFFTMAESDELARVAVLGSKIATKLFGNQDPIGQEIKLGKGKFRVIGVMEERGGSFGMDFDEFVFAPLGTMQKLVMGVDYVQWITAQMEDTSKDSATANEIEYVLRQRHEIEKADREDFSVTTMAEAKAMIDTIFNGITLLLIAIAGMSLIVGGVGIMNIMYVSVIERTFEIGLRKAVGARKNQILWQFLLEAIILTLFGGIAGIILGIGAAWLISFIATQLGFTWTFILPPTAVALAFGFCGAVGLLFGYFPARQAANLNPIEALRKE